MSTLRLTDISSAQSTALTPTTLIHIVTTADTTQFSGGSSYKASLSQVFDSLSAYTIPNLTVNTFSSDTISATTIDLCGTNGTLYTDSISGCSPINFLSESNFVSGLTATTVSATTYENLPVSGVTSTGTGVSLISSIVDGDVRIKSISGNTLGKISADTISETVELDVVEPNLDLWSLVVQGNRLLYGEVSYVSGLTFEITNLKYIINGDIYTSSGGTIVLPSGSTDDRIDVIYADTSSLIGSISGTPSPNPEKPVVDGASQVEVTFVNVPASASSLNFSGYVIYNENVGPPSEWTFGSGGVQPTRIIGNNTTIAYTGTTSIRVSAVTSPSYQTYFRLTGSTAFDTNDYAVLQFAIRNLVSNSTSNRIQLRFLTTGGTQNGSSVLMNALGGVGYVQYSSTNTSSWQLISIPLWRFYLTNTNVQVLEVSFWPIGGSLQSNYYFDYFEFRKGSSSSPPTNSWTTIRGDLATPSITATNPNSTLIISGGTNIGSTVTSPNRVNINLDNYITLSGVTATTIGASGNCVNDLYVNNIHSCSPLNINPLNEGNVYFGSTSAVTIDLSNNRVGIGTSTPSVKLQVKGIDDTSGNTSFLVETSGATPLFSVRNDGFSSVYNASQQFGEKLSVNGTVLAGTSGYLIQDGGSGYWQMYSSGNLFGIGKNALTSPIFGIDVNSPFYIFTQQAYDFGIGLGNTAPSAKLHVNNTTVANTVLFEDDTNPDSTPFVITNAGNVGVGITSPTSKLHIETTGTTDPFKITASSVGLANINYNGTGIAIGNGANYTLATIPNYSRAMSLGFLATSSTPDDEVSTAVGHYTTANANRGSLALGNSAISSGYYTASIGNQVSATGTYSMMIGLGMSNWGNYPINNNVNYSIAFGVANDVPTMWIVNPSPGLTGSTNNVGIGTSAPTEKLEISGKTKTTSLQVTSGATTGYVLTSSDNNGNATWSPVSGITGVVNKYTISTGFTANETKTITHSLNTKFVHCSVWDVVTEQLITAQVVRTLGNINDAVDITIATAGTYDILITG